MELARSACWHSCCALVWRQTLCVYVWNLVQALELLAWNWRIGSEIFGQVTFVRQLSFREPPFLEEASKVSSWPQRFSWFSYPSRFLARRPCSCRVGPELAMGSYLLWMERQCQALQVIRPLLASSSKFGHHVRKIWKEPQLPWSWRLPNAWPRAFFDSMITTTSRTCSLWRSLGHL